MFLKKLIPQSIFERFLLMIVVPTIIVQIVAIYVFYYSYVDTISKHMARGVLSEMVFIRNSINIKGSKQLVNQFSENIDLKFYFQAGKKLKKTAKLASQRQKENEILAFFDPLPIVDPLNRFKIELENYGFTPFAINDKRDDDDFLIVKIQLPEGVLNFQIPKKRITSSAKYVFTLWMFLTSLLTSLVSILFLKNQIRSIKGLSIAADKLGRGDDAPDFRPSGAKEIRSVGISFIRMKERIMRQIDQRTQMLSAVSHDLRTPLTRMKLQLEMMPQDEAVSELKSDISDMEKMINEYLEFARGGEKEKVKVVKIKEFLEKLIDYYQTMGKDIKGKFAIDDNLEMFIKKNIIKRAIRNLVDNAFRYGDKVLISAEVNSSNLKIAVDDNGCGIPESEWDNVFKPFYRIDNSRNLDKNGSSFGGAGLGLSIVMDAISSSGGRIQVGNSPMKGLRMEIYLPL